mmetsp:Transcript_5256/g.11425  ORF Transcript_5256/g.11425 Transcript_5256/m.11425 type:complete len:264 (-) Transcript_5256:46-837(-)|eukprot:CAMPEP_0178548994 /NCGR_PEP_ID=MMETSP0697-20121206/5496_1 /TAXON_ID=265572 /ORGANISM="Extubocellulus spinifer, Strain CCMP396" /LENGTH=263 /DNA_ID=CAMNT_0020181713 /DNA_START=159 /DNA_END=950 /DNA_ORIENTATION=+
MNNELKKQLQKQTKGEERRKREDDRLQQEYRGIFFSSRQSSGRPGTPHRYFESSYDVIESVYSDGASDGAATETKSSSVGSGQDDIAKSCASNKHNIVQSSQVESSSPHAPGQIINRHANGLCIVTAGDVVKKACEPTPSNANRDATTSSIHPVRVEFVVKAARGQSVGSKRRKKMAKRNKDSNRSGSGEDRMGVARPSEELARVELSNGSSIRLDCCVFGTILEINENLIDTPSLLVDDPLLDGYLAVIMPHGPFPFPGRIE